MGGYLMVANWIAAVTVAVGVVLLPQPVPLQFDQQVCQEDMPCWDCHSMGNRLCGNEIEGIK
jgi:hypothetical protein